MLQSIFTVYDEKAKAHLQPFFMARQEQAIRSFTDCINSPEHTFSRHPEDYTLFIHGSWDDENAAFTLQSHPKPLGNGVEYIQIPTDREIPDARSQKVSNDSPLRLNPTG